MTRQGKIDVWVKLPKIPILLEILESDPDFKVLETKTQHDHEWSRITCSRHTYEKINQFFMKPPKWEIVL